MLTAAPEELVFWDWSLSTWSSVGQFLLAGLGIYLAIHQLTRTASASEATAAAAKRTADATEEANDILQRRLLNNDLLVFLPELHDLEDDLGNALSTGKPKEVEDSLMRFIRRGGSILGYLDGRDLIAESNLPTLIQQALKSAQEAKSDVAGGSDRELVDVVQLTRKKMLKVGTETARVIAALREKPDNGNYD
ncbi:hypothetical protein Q0F99_18975 [Rathayibacter oskolensis]|uniref:hypothetical protein n=1 Tax=Rathayibacter oskolensis TaxID=1891671 RepID=UPI00265E7A51|nr:hypothetical protein [Rathayibacter oskolensis]WKK71425.1 hypothetical protein Q0F99_18975 [Rathayibacter oskolensis]